MTTCGRPRTRWMMRCYGHPSPTDRTCAVSESQIMISQWCHRDLAPTTVGNTTDILTPAPRWVKFAIWGCFTFSNSNRSFSVRARLQRLPAIEISFSSHIRALGLLAVSRSGAMVGTPPAFPLRTPRLHPWGGIPFLPKLCDLSPFCHYARKGGAELGGAANGLNDHFASLDSPIFSLPHCMEHSYCWTSSVSVYSPC